jgi:hypothetical protein
LKDFSIANYKKGETLLHMVLELIFLDWKSNSDKMNAAAGASKVGFLARSF